MKQKLPFTIENIAPLSSVEVIVSPFVKDNQIVLRAPKMVRHPESAFAAFASYHITIWDLETGEMSGDCDPTKATEWHMSAHRFNQLKKMVNDPELVTPKERKEQM